MLALAMLFALVGALLNSQTFAESDDFAETVSFGVYYLHPGSNHPPSDQGRIDIGVYHHLAPQSHTAFFDVAQGLQAEGVREVTALEKHFASERSVSHHNWGTAGGVFHLFRTPGERTCEVTYRTSETDCFVIFPCGRVWHMHSQMTLIGSVLKGWPILKQANESSCVQNPHQPDCVEGLYIKDVVITILPAPKRRRRDDPFLNVISLALSQLAYHKVKENVSIPLGTKNDPFFLHGVHRYAVLDVRRFFKAGGNIQKITVLAQVHKGHLTRRVLVLAFRGSADLLDVIRDTFVLFDRGTFANEELNVHAGFAAAVSDPNEYAQMLEVLFTVKDIDEVIITGHSLGGAAAQIASLHAYKLHGLIKAFKKPEQMALWPIFDKLDKAAPEERTRILDLLDQMRCITFESPSPFAPARRFDKPSVRREAKAVRKWMALNAINYCTATDPVPLWPQHVEGSLEIAAKALPKLADGQSTKLAGAFLALQGEFAKVRLVSIFPERWTGAKEQVLSAVAGLVSVVINATTDMREECKEYESLTPTIFIGPDEPAEGILVAASRVNLWLKRNFDLLKGSMNMADSTAFAESVYDAVNWHFISNVEPFVLASVGARLPLSFDSTKFVSIHAWAEHSATSSHEDKSRGEYEL